MRITALIILWMMAMPMVSNAQVIVGYTYDNAGNRVKRQVIFVNAKMDNPNDSLPDYDVNEQTENPIEVEGEQEQALAIESILDGANVKIYPNPVSETLIISISKFSDYTAEISVYDMSGRLLQTQESSSRTAPLSFQNYSVGSYVLRIRVNNEQKEWLIVKK